MVSTQHSPQEIRGVGELADSAELVDEAVVVGQCRPKIRVTVREMADEEEGEGGAASVQESGIEGVGGAAVGEPSVRGEEGLDEAAADGDGGGALAAAVEAEEDVEVGGVLGSCVEDGFFFLVVVVGMAMVTLMRAMLW